MSKKGNIPNDMVVGTIHKSKNCGDFEIISYVKSNEVFIRFINTGYSVSANVGNIRTGKIADKTCYRIPADMAVGYVHKTNKGESVVVIKYFNKTKVLVEFVGTGEQTYTTTLILRKGSLVGEGYTPLDMRKGCVHITTNYGSLEIIEYLHAGAVTVKFLDTGCVRHNISSNCIREGRVMDKTKLRVTVLDKELVYGIGVNDADYAIRKNKPISEGGKEFWRCPYYSKWKDMLKRCYCPSSLKKDPSYKDCIVCEEWLTFSNFKLWMEKQDWQDKQLDKDLKVLGNRVYSPDTCMFVTCKVNTIINSKFDLSVGASSKASSTKYYASCSNPFDLGKDIYLGTFNSVAEANSAHRVKKVSYVKKVAKEEGNSEVKALLFKRFNIEEE